MIKTTAIEAQVEEAAGHAKGLLRSRFGLWALAGISFVESALLLPILTDPFLVVYILADKASMKRAVVVTTISSVFGGVFAYVMALAFYEYIAAQFLVGTVGEQFYLLASQFEDGAFLLSFLGALTPIPYTLVALGAGFVQSNIFLFILGSFVGRSIRYGIVGWLTYRFGEHAVSIARKRILVTSVVAIIGVIGYLLLKL